MSTEPGSVTALPPRTITTPTRAQRSNTIRAAVDRFAAQVELTASQRHLLGLIIDEAIEAVAPKPATLASDGASNDAVLR
ncbi:hypothetical protein [Trinickia soli]|uniref:Uncharacterized protein n=1 Tax=Trinickia soli TaxID=380675 RepID=A0A2N7W8F0_9BURK|nr:hypothetical protein [Trinickia soli]KAA0082291.1 hypothetical protein CIW54_20670 [Paraburkholderia sp. T12-10]PMS25686.1 hypothetical protein C0Z19_08970 [Trinickia soli]CAB3640530.1 hypothetical protein LMG24076_00236 [Trinickia soli]